MSYLLTYQVGQAVRGIRQLFSIPEEDVDACIAAYRYLQVTQLLSHNKAWLQLARKHIPQFPSISYFWLVVLFAPNISMDRRARRSLMASTAWQTKRLSTCVATTPFCSPCCALQTSKKCSCELFFCVCIVGVRVLRVSVAVYGAIRACLPRVGPVKTCCGLAGTSRHFLTEARASMATKYCTNAKCLTSSM